MSCVLCLVSCVLCLVSCVLCFGPYVLCLVSCVLCLVSCVLCLVTCVLCFVSCVLSCLVSSCVCSPNINSNPSTCPKRHPNLDRLAPRMPPKQTYQQIKERNEREIRIRTQDRIAALMVQNMTESARQRRNVMAESDVVVIESDEEDSEDERPFRNEGVDALNKTLTKRRNMFNSSPTCVVCLRRQEYWTACVRLSCVLLFLFLLLCLNRMYHT